MACRCRPSRTRPPARDRSRARWSTSPRAFFILRLNSTQAGQCCLSGRPGVALEVIVAAPILDEHGRQPRGSSSRETRPRAAPPPVLSACAPWPTPPAAICLPSTACSTRIPMRKTTKSPPMRAVARLAMMAGKADLRRRNAPGRYALGSAQSQWAKSAESQLDASPPQYAHES